MSPADDVNQIGNRFYDTYVSTHAGRGQERAADIIYRNSIRPYLPSKPGSQRVLDIGCGQGELVDRLQRDGFDAAGVDISPEQVELARAKGIDRIELGDFHAHLESTSWNAVIATDLLEHLDKDDVVRTFDDVRRALRPGGVFLARVPNAVSPTGGHIMYGDVTHQTWFTARSISQLAAVTGFGSVRAFACPPAVHGVKSAARVLVWKPISGLIKLALAAETGQMHGHIITQNLTFVAHREAANVMVGSQRSSRR